MLPVGTASAESRSKLNRVDGIVDGMPLSNDRPQREARRTMERALTYMLQNLDKPIQMATLGKLAGVSMSHFYHLFKLATGHTPNDFLIRARIGHACELLRETDLSVKEIAAALGYDDQFYFSRVFKSVSSVSPRDYRGLMAESACPSRRTTLKSFERKTFESRAPFPSEPQRNQPDRALTSTKSRKTVLSVS